MLGCHSAEAVMVGDCMDTDVISGMESGMSTVLVLWMFNEGYTKLILIFRQWY